MPHKEPLIFNTVRCKLSSVVKSEKALLEFKKRVLLAHEVHKRTSSFFRLYCLSRDELPEVSESTLKLCANQISVRSASGAKAKDDGNLSEKFQSFWKDNYRDVHPEKLDVRGKCRMVAEIASSACSAVLVDIKTHFRTRFNKLVLRWTEEKHAESPVQLSWVAGRRCRLFLLQTN